MRGWATEMAEEKELEDSAMALYMTKSAMSEVVRQQSTRKRHSQLRRESRLLG